MKIYCKKNQKLSKNSCRRREKKEPFSGGKKPAGTRAKNGAKNGENGATVKKR